MLLKMRSEEEHGTVGIEDVLGTVAVMDIPIGDQHPSDSMLFLRVASCDRDVIENEIGRRTRYRRYRRCPGYRCRDGHPNRRSAPVRFHAFSARSELRSRCY